MLLDFLEIILKFKRDIMSKSILSHIRKLYSQENINIIEYLKKNERRAINNTEDILISYDFQAGTYIEKYRKNPKYRDKYLTRLANVIDELDCKKTSIFECGVGEATVMVPLLNKLKTRFLMGGG